MKKIGVIYYFYSVVKVITLFYLALVIISYIFVSPFFSPLTFILLFSLSLFFVLAVSSYSLLYTIPSSTNLFLVSKFNYLLSVTTNVDSSTRLFLPFFLSTVFSLSFLNIY